MYRTVAPWKPATYKKQLDVFRTFLRSQTNIAVEAEELEKAKPPEEIPGPLSLPIIGTLYKYLPAGKYFQSGVDLTILVHLDLFTYLYHVFILYLQYHYNILSLYAIASCVHKVQNM